MRKPKPSALVERIRIESLQPFSISIDGVQGIAGETLPLTSIGDFTAAIKQCQVSSSAVPKGERC